MPYLASNREHLSVVAFGGRAPEGHERRSILICDSELESVRVLKTVLRGAGLTAFSVPTAEDALKRVTLRVPDAVIVETDLLDSDGLEVSRRLREWSSMPLIVVSRVSDEDRVIQAFRSGADDYITKPFRPGELVARVQAHLRRAQVGESEPVLQWDGLSVDLAARVVRRNGAETRLTPTEFKLLSALARNRGRVVTHEELLREVWGVGYAGDRPVLRGHMANLRRKLGSQNSPSVIHTYPGGGYLLEDRAARRARTADLATLVARHPRRTQALLSAHTGRLLSLHDATPNEEMEDR